MNDRNALWGDLLRRGRGGDAAAYGRFLAEAAPVIRRIARARLPGSPADEVEDVVQEVLLALHAKRHTWRETEPVTPWLYAIARYKCADAARRRLGRRAAGADVPIDDLAELLPDEAAGGEVTAARDLGRLLDRIEPRAAGIVRAVGIEGRSAGEVGAGLGMSEGAVRVAYHRAMRRLRGLAREDEDRAVPPTDRTPPEQAGRAGQEGRPGGMRHSPPTRRRNGSDG